MKVGLCVGINHYPVPGNDLRGCVNDAEAWAALLQDHFGFGKVRIVMDAEATKGLICEALSSMITGARAGDVLVFTNSSHGTYLADASADEAQYDEAICPYDCDRNLLVDDELREMFMRLRDDVSLTVISDSCHSGSVTRRYQTPDEGYCRCSQSSSAT